jgi:hypothetical protein
MPHQQIDVAGLDGGESFRVRGASRSRSVLLVGAMLALVVCGLLMYVNIGSANAQPVDLLQQTCPGCLAKISKKIQALSVDQQHMAEHFETELDHLQKSVSLLNAEITHVNPRSGLVRVIKSAPVQLSNGASEASNAVNTQATHDPEFDESGFKKGADRARNMRDKKYGAFPNRWVDKDTVEAFADHIYGPNPTTLDRKGVEREGYFTMAKIHSGMFYYINLEGVSNHHIKLIMQGTDGYNREYEGYGSIYTGPIYDGDHGVRDYFEVQDLVSGDVEFFRFSHPWTPPAMK